MRGLAVLYIDKGQLKWSMGTGLIHPLDICMMYNLGDLNDPSIRKIKEREKILGMLSLIERKKIIIHKACFGMTRFYWFTLMSVVVATFSVLA